MHSQPVPPYILYIDDDEDDLQIMKEILSSINPDLSLVCFKNGKDGFQFLEEIEMNQPLPCVIVIDWNMPVWDGMKTLAAIKEKDVYQGIPVYIFTNSNHPRHKQEALAAGAKDFLSKPYELTNFKNISREFASYTLHPVQFKKT